MRNIIVLVNGRPVNITLAAAREGIINSLSDIKTVTIAIKTQSDEVIAKTNTSDAEPIIELYRTSAAGGSETENETLFLLNGETTI